MNRLLILCILCSPAWAQRGEDAPPSGLKAQLDTLLAKDFLKTAKLGLHIVRLDTGATVYSKNGDTKLHPASNTKVVTVAAALDALGPAFTFRTDLATDRYDDGAAGNLYLIGRGDPGFLSEHLYKMVGDARHYGLRRVRGDIVVDDSWFTKETMAPGFDDKDQDSAYRAATGAASINYNGVLVRLRPGKKVGDPVRVDTRPGGGYAIIRNKATTVAKKADRLALRAKAEKGRTALIVSGSIGVDHAGIQVRRRIDNPALFTGHAVKATLREMGVKFSGKVRVGKVPGKTRRLARKVSRNLAELSGDVNKYSNNFMAEHLVRALGKAKKEVGDWKNGGAVVSDFLRRKVRIDGFRYDNGSGLFGKTAFSARQLVQVLRYMHRRSPPLPEFAASLAVAGADGTLRKRLKKLPKGSIRAKTGTLSGVICLTGYFQFADGTPGAFSFLVNKVKAKPWSVWQVQDGILTALAGHTPR